MIDLAAQLKDWTYAPQALPGRRRSVLGLWWFVASLGLFFGSALLTVALVLVFAKRPDDFSLPPLLFASTPVALVAGWLASAAVRLVRRERQTALRRSLAGAIGLGVLFCVLQVVALSGVVAEHLPKFAERRASVAAELAEIEDLTEAGLLAPEAGFERRQAVYADSPLPFSGGLLSLVVLHVLHFAAGLSFGGWVTWRAWRGDFDHEYYEPVRYNAIYWRFMDGVWVATFALLLCV